MLAVSDQFFPTSHQVFRDFATGAELAHIRKEGHGKLERAVAYNEGKFKPVEFRISTAGWLDRNHDDVIMRINNRIADVTQLSLEYAEPLQVSNCRFIVQSSLLYTAIRLRV